METASTGKAGTYHTHHLAVYCIWATPGAIPSLNNQAPAGILGVNAATEKQSSPSVIDFVLTTDDLSVSRVKTSGFGKHEQKMQASNFHIGC